MVDTNSKVFVKRWFWDAARFCCSKAIFLFRTFTPYTDVTSTNDEQKTQEKYHPRQNSCFI